MTDLSFRELSRTREPFDHTRERVHVTDANGTEWIAFVDEGIPVTRRTTLWRRTLIEGELNRDVD